MACLAQSFPSFCMEGVRDTPAGNERAGCLPWTISLDYLGFIQIT